VATNYQFFGRQARTCPNCQNGHNWLREISNIFIFKELHFMFSMLKGNLSTFCLIIFFEFFDFLGFVESVESLSLFFAICHSDFPFPFPYLSRSIFRVLTTLHLLPITSNLQKYTPELTSFPLLSFPSHTTSDLPGFCTSFTRVLTSCPKRL